MTVYEAYILVKEKIKDPFIIMNCKEYDKYYAFTLGPVGVTSGQKVFVGSEMLCVNKENGELYFDEAPRHEHPVRVLNQTIISKLNAG